MSDQLTVVTPIFQGVTRLGSFRPECALSVERR